MKKSLLIFGLLLFNAILALSQEYDVTGSVFGLPDKEPLPGVTVMVKGSTTGTITDFDGKFTIKVPSKDAVLVFSFIGFETLEENVNSRTTLNIGLKLSVVDISDVIVIGYGTQRKEDLSSSIATLEAAELVDVPGGLNAGIQSSVAGVQITGDKIRIRGVGSINNTDPLYVVDGMIGGAVPDENDIESIQILKDAASCAIYGARGANGVILISSKRGKAGKTKIHYNGYMGTKKLTNNIDLLNGQQLAELINEEMYNADPTRTDYLEALSNPEAIGEGYNMVDELLRTGSYQKHNLSISGGSEQATFRINTTYGTDEPVTIKDKNKDISFQILSDFKHGKLEIGESVKTSFHNRNYGSFILVDGQKWSSTMPIYSDTGETGFGGAGNGTDTDNPLANANFTDRNNQTISVVGNAFVSYEILKGLKYKLNFGVDLYRARNQEYEKSYFVGSYQSNATDDLLINSSQTNRLLYENTLSYDRTFDKHNISAVFGVTSEETKYNFVRASSSYLPSPDVLILNATQDPDSKEVESNMNSNSMFSMLGRVSYSYDSKYMLTANFRRDGSSRFGSDNRFGTFPSFSAAWRVSQEGFMESVPFISDLKLRGSYGALGNSNIANYQYQSTVSFSSVWYYLNNTKVSGASPLTPSNPNVKWESQYSTDLGFDLALLDNKFSITFDYFNKKTEDMLVNVPISYVAGYLDNFPVLNSGSIRNKGIELSATYRETRGKLSYSVSANVTTVKNEVLSLGNGNEILSGKVDPLGENVTRTAVGSSIGQFWGYTTNGLYTTQAQLDEDASFAPNAGLGDIRFVDLNDDGAITADKDKAYIGNPIPKFSYGFSANMSYTTNYGVLDFSMVWQGSYGNDIYSNMKNWGEGMYHYYNCFASTLDRYRAEELVFVNPVSGKTTIYPKNTGTDMPRAILGDPNKNMRASDRYIEDGSYLRLKSLIIGYTLPESLLNTLKISNLRFYVGGKNLLTFTDYDGFDPEVPSDNSVDNGRFNLNRGIDAQTPWGLTFLNTRELFFGVQCNF